MCVMMMDDDDGCFLGKYLQFSTHARVGVGVVFLGYCYCFLVHACMSEVMNYSLFLYFEERQSGKSWMGCLGPLRYC